MKIKIPNPFNFQSRKTFIPQVKANPPGEELILDFENVSSLDSAALGMLLMAREQTKSTSSKVSFINCNDSIKQILEVAQFHMLFKIS
ncbi:MAG: STAS domain-containing protein [Magnetococcales bacterium]|nr:STAS domain-containing protein [Magnetococcales bacterium]